MGGRWKTGGGVGWVERDKGGGGFKSTGWRGERRGKREERGLDQKQPSKVPTQFVRVQLNGDINTHAVCKNGELIARLWLRERFARSAREAHVHLLCTRHSKLWQ